MAIIFSLQYSVLFEVTKQCKFLFTTEKKLSWETGIKVLRPSKHRTTFEFRLNRSHRNNAPLHPLLCWFIRLFLTCLLIRPWFMLQMWSKSIGNSSSNGMKVDDNGAFKIYAELPHTFFSLLPWRACEWAREKAEMREKVSGARMFEKSIHKK